MAVRSLILVILIVSISASEIQLPRKRPGSELHPQERSQVIEFECIIGLNNNDLPDPQPLLLRPGGSKDVFGFYLPSSRDGFVHVLGGQNIRVACPGASNHLSLFPGVKEVNATCLIGSSFTVNGKTYNFKQLACQSIATHVAKASGKSCYKGNTSIDIGFEVNRDFFKLINICFNQAGKYTLYGQFDLVAEIGGAEVGVESPHFVADTFFPGIGITNLYSRASQIRTFTNQRIKEEYVGENMSRHDYYLARGHLAAKTDFVYGTQQNATFHYVNVAPQWQTFNAGTWKSIEYSIRKYAADHTQYLTVYTGTYGVTTLPNETNVPTELYLYMENRIKAVPVPKLFWKVVYNATSKEGVAILGVNNPHILASDLGADYMICPDISASVPWVRRATNDVKKGITYCCEVKDFREKIDFLPPFEVKGLLT